jgi:flagellar basal body-associated protein FliL
MGISSKKIFISAFVVVLLSTIFLGLYLFVDYTNKGNVTPGKTNASTATEISGRIYCKAPQKNAPVSGVDLVLKIDGQENLSPLKKQYVAKTDANGLWKVIVPSTIKVSNIDLLDITKTNNNLSRDVYVPTKCMRYSLISTNEETQSSEVNCCRDNAYATCPYIIGENGVNYSGTFDFAINDCSTLGKIGTVVETQVSTTTSSSSSSSRSSVVASLSRSSLPKSTESSSTISTSSSSSDSSTTSSTSSKSIIVSSSKSSTATNANSSNLETYKILFIVVASLFVVLACSTIVYFFVTRKKGNVTETPGIDLTESGSFNPSPIQ